MCFLCGSTVGHGFHMRIEEAMPWRVEVRPVVVLDILFFGFSIGERWYPVLLEKYMRSFHNESPNSSDSCLI